MYSRVPQKFSILRLGKEDNVEDHVLIEGVSDIKKTYQWQLKVGQMEKGSTTADRTQCKAPQSCLETVQQMVALCKIQGGPGICERHHRVAGIVSGNICAEFRLDLPTSQWDTPVKVGENNRALMWDLKFWTDKQLVTNQPDTEVIDKEKKRWQW